MKAHMKARMVVDSIARDRRLFPTVPKPRLTEVYTFSSHTTEHQRDCIVLSLRKAGHSASRESDTLRTNASRTELALAWGNALCVTAH